MAKIRLLEMQAGVHRSLNTSMRMAGEWIVCLREKWVENVGLYIYGMALIRHPLLYN
jgi:hypothetical protein